MNCHDEGVVQLRTGTSLKRRGRSDPTRLETPLEPIFWTFSIITNDLSELQLSGNGYMVPCMLVWRLRRIGGGNQQTGMTFKLAREDIIIARFMYFPRFMDDSSRDDALRAVVEDIS